MQFHTLPVVHHCHSTCQYSGHMVMKYHLLSLRYSRATSTHKNILFFSDIANTLIKEMRGMLFAF